MTADEPPRRPAPGWFAIAPELSAIRTELPGDVNFRYSWVMTSVEAYELTTQGGATDFARLVKACQSLGPYCLIGGLAVSCLSNLYMRSTLT
jgi:hypothetical protein